MSGNNYKETLSKVAQFLDSTSTFIGVGTTVIGIVGVFVPLPAPLSTGSLIAGGVVVTYGAYRSIATLIDRRDREQSISLADSEARLHWLSLTTSFFAIVSGGNLKTA
jgi:hypothetical protein